MRVNKTRAIRLFCLDCCGGSSKDVLLCTAPECPLWNFRTGRQHGSKAYNDQMASASKTYDKDIADMKSYGLDPAIYAPPGVRIKPRPGPGMGGSGTLFRPKNRG